MKVLVALDGSRYRDIVLASLGDRPWPNDTEFLLLHCLEPFLMQTPEGVVMPADFYGKMAEATRRQAESILEKSVDYLKKNFGFSHKIITRVEDGAAKEVILSQAQEFDADRIILGSHGYSLLERIFLGSVSLYVASHAPCTVEIVRRKNKLCTQ